MRGQGCASARHASRPPTAWAPPPPLPRPPPELGHHCLRHAPLAFCLGQAALLARCALFAAARRAEGLHEAFGFPPGERPALAGLLLFSVLAAPLDEAAAAAGNALSRRFELAADRFAAELDHGRHGRHLRGALLHLEDRNKVCGVCVAGGGVRRAGGVECCLLALASGKVRAAAAAARRLSGQRPPPKPLHPPCTGGAERRPPVCCCQLLPPAAGGAPRRAGCTDAGRRQEGRLTVERQLTAGGLVAARTQWSSKRQLHECFQMLGATGVTRVKGHGRPHRTLQRA